MMDSLLGSGLPGKKYVSRECSHRPLPRLLVQENPEGIVVIDSDSQCLRLYNPRLGMFPPLHEQEVPGLTEHDKKFLRAMRIEICGFDKPH